MNRTTADPWQIKTRMQAGETLFGAMLTLPSATIAETLVECGFDWFFVDGEHGALDTGDVLNILQAVSEKIACFVRVGEASELAIKRALDLGAQGVIVPQVNDAETAARVVQWSRYPPQGTRGVGLSRAHGYGKGFKHYVENANQRVVVIVQAEHRDAVDNIESIVGVPGIDAIQLGPFDLSASMGMTGRIDAPEVQQGIEKVCQACLLAGIPIATFGIRDSNLKADQNRGATLICAGTDTSYLQSGAEKILDKIRNKA